MMGADPKTGIRILVLKSSDGMVLSLPDYRVEKMAENWPSYQRFPNNLTLICKD